MQAGRRETTHTTVPALLAGVLAGAIWLAAASATAASSPASRAATPISPAGPRSAAAEVRGYWTARRLRAADPGGVVIGSAGGLRHPSPDGPPRAGRASADRRAAEISSQSATFPGRVHGKVFFTIAGGSEPGDYVCSGTVVGSHGHDLVWTAGHCVDDSEFGGGFATNWVFAPGYDRGVGPAGLWPATRLATTAAWAEGQDLRQDLGVATIARDQQGRGIEDVVGGRPIAFGLSRARAYTAFGYPAQPTLFQPFYDGERLYSCDSALTASDNPPGSGPETMQISCDMSGGSSGGGWVTTAGAVAGLTSYSYAGDLDHLYGPYLGATAERLYRRASGPPLLCGGRQVTSLGDPGANSFSGSSRPDTFSLGGGGDRARGLAGRDLACGGGGADRLSGGGGGDLLRGGPGTDVLVGGPGRDRCVGGPGRDRASGCEQRIQIP